MVTLLSDILESKQPADLLAFLLVAPERAFSVRELAARLNTTSTSVSNSVKTLEQTNFVRSFSKGGTKFYLLNLRHAQVKSLREECLTELGAWPDELFASLKKLGQLSGIFLSGLFVGRTELPVDVLLIGKVSLGKLEGFLATAKKLTGNEINYSIMTREEFELRRDTFDRFIKDIFDYPHIIVYDKPKPPRVKTTKKANVKAKPKKKVKASPKLKTKTASKRKIVKKVVKTKKAKTASKKRK
ncbi:MAG TPA: helix-turn-helix domain-containing protein [Candidatus Doudnabacteria bacterium]|nr:helix-turn-helix domain-containing protein [Candidatus Doudnabacteria bacterium]